MARPDALTPTDGAALVQSRTSAEIGVIGSMLLDSGCIPGILRDCPLRPEDFAYASLRRTFETILSLYRDKKPIDALTVAAALDPSGQDRETRQILADTLDHTPTAANALEYAKILRDTARLSRLRDIGLQLARADSADAANALIDEAVRLRADNPNLRVQSFADLFLDFGDRHNPENGVKSLPWPVPQMDGVLHAGPGTYAILGAYPGTGKTAFALQAADKFAASGEKIGYFLLESTAGKLYDRHFARVALVPGDRISQNKLTDDDWQAYFDLRDRLSGPKIDVIDAAGMTADDITATATARGYSVVIIDYIQQIDAPRSERQTEYQRVTEVSHALQKFAVRSGVTVLALSQLSRPEKVRYKYKDDDGRQAVKSITPPPSMSDLRSSGQIEQDADIILLMWRKDDDDANSPRILQIAKNRNGEAGARLWLAFDGPHQNFSRIEPRADLPKAPPRRKYANMPDNQTSFFDAEFAEIPDENNDMPF